MSEPPLTDAALSTSPGIPNLVLDRGALRVHQAVMTAARQRASMIAEREELERARRAERARSRRLTFLLAALIVVVVVSSGLIWLERESDRRAYAVARSAPAPTSAHRVRAKAVEMPAVPAAATVTKRPAVRAPTRYTLRVDVRLPVEGAGAARATINGQPYVPGDAIELDAAGDGLARADLVVSADGYRTYEHTIYLGDDSHRIVELIPYPNGSE